MAGDDQEICFYREVEDFFASLRGVPHTLSPADFQLLRGWWRDQVPLAAVIAGVTEAVTKRRERGEGGPVVSLRYCRHAVRAHARRIAEMRAGSGDGPEQAGTAPAPDSADRLATVLAEAAETHRAELPRVGVVLDGLARQIWRSRELPQAALEEHLFNLEAAMLEGCWAALPEDRRAMLEQRAEAAAQASGATGEALARTCRAIRDRELRRLLGVPRLELG